LAETEMLSCWRMSASQGRAATNRISGLRRIRLAASRLFISLEDYRFFLFVFFFAKIAFQFSL